MKGNLENAIGIINGFLNELVGGQGEWGYSLSDGVGIDMSNSVLGLWTEDLKISLIHNRGKRSVLTVLDFSQAKILKETEKMLIISTINGNITLCYN